MPNRTTRRFWSVLLITWCVIAITIYLSATNGAFDIAVIDVIKTLLRINPVPEHDLVLFDFRLPRIVIGMLVGFGLGIAGAVIQSVTRNGLADPGMLGIHAGSGAAVVLFMFMFQGKMSSLGWISIMVMPVFGLIGGLCAVALILLLARQHGRLDPQRLILVGIAVGSGFSALTLFVSLKMNPQDFEAAAAWLAGSIHSANWVYAASMLPWFIVLLPLIGYRVYILDLLQLGEDCANSLGVRVEREKYLLLLGSVGLVSACVSVSGSIGFVGLLAPHIARRLVGLLHLRMLPVCGFVGMAMVVLGDFIGKTAFAPAQLPVGIVVSIIGVPYFVYLLMKSRA